MTRAEAIPAPAPAADVNAAEVITTSAAAGPLAIQVGARIRHTRKGRGLTLAQIATACGTTSQSVQRLEAGGMTLSVDWIEKLAAALDVEPVTFFRPETELKDEEQRAALLERQARRVAAANLRLEAALLEDETGRQPGDR